MKAQSQAEFKVRVKAWLKRHELHYSWLAEHSFVSEVTVRNWMAQKPIPESKVYLIEQAMLHYPAKHLCRVIDLDQELILHLTAQLKGCLEKNAHSLGKSLPAYLNEMLRELAST